MSRAEDRVRLAVAPLIEPEWSVERREQALAGLHARRARRARGMRVAALGSALTVLALSVGFGLHARSKAQANLAERDGRQVRFGDGSAVQLQDAASVLDVGAASASAVEVSLRAGSADFEITPNPKRRFIVHAGAADISVLGTHFRVTREAQRVKVEVTRGRVEVRYLGGARQLTPGESNWFPPPEASADDSKAPEPSLAPAAPAPSPASSALVPAPSANLGAEGNSPRRRFLDHATHGEYADAYSVLERAPEVVGNSAEDLMLAADAARFSNHPLAATHFLERTTREHASDSVAPLAAFTLGRIYMSQLGQPAKAADAFALALRLAPAGTLAEDAQAREAEAAQSAGQGPRARALAMDYARRYPNGRHLQSVRKAVGLGAAP